jgi:hypothetical protein
MKSTFSNFIADSGTFSNFIADFSKVREPFSGSPSSFYSNFLSGLRARGCVNNVNDEALSKKQDSDAVVSSRRSAQSKSRDFFSKISLLLLVFRVFT